MVFEVIGGPYGVLYYVWIGAQEWKSDYFALYFAPGIIDVIMAVFFEVNPVIGSANGHQIPHSIFCVATFNDISGY